MEIKDFFVENDQLAPMHDMSYMDRSVPKEEGQKLRNRFGRDMIERGKKQVTELQKMGIDINLYIIRGRTHNNYSGHGVNEYISKFQAESYIQSGGICDPRYLSTSIKEFQKGIEMLKDLSVRELSFDKMLVK